MDGLPGDIICCSILPYLSVRDLQSLDTAYTNKDLRPHLLGVWKLYNYDSVEKTIQAQEAAWLAGAGVKVSSMTLGSVGDSAKILSIHLTKLHVHTTCSNSFLMSLAQCCPQLEVLRIEGKYGYSDDGLISLAQHCHQLHTIFWYGDRTSIATIQALCDNCPHLRHIHCNKVADASLVCIANTYPHLQSVTVSGYNITDASLVAIADKCNELISVTIRDCSNITSSGLAILWAANPNLTDVDISYNRFISDDDIMLLLQCCPQLQTMNIMYSRYITDAAVINVAEHCPQLISLNIAFCKNVSDVGLIALGQHCHGLKSVDISNNQNISDAGMSALAAGCPLLREFVAFSTNITDADMVALTRGCRDLRKVILNGCKSIGFDTISAIAKNCPLVSELFLCYCDSVYDS